MTLAISEMMAFSEKSIPKIELEARPDGIVFSDAGINKTLREMQAKLGNLHIDDQTAILGLTETALRQRHEPIRQPEVDFAPTTPELSKHFVMVNPLHPNNSGTDPKGVPMKIYAKWEALRRSLLASGAQVTAIDCLKNNNPRYTYVRDTFASAGGIAFLADNAELSVETEAKRLLLEKMVGGDYVRKELNRQGEAHRMQNFLEDLDHRVGFLQDYSLDGGNVITDPLTKTIFLGDMPAVDDREQRYIERDLETFKFVVQRMLGDEWSVMQVLLADKQGSTDSLEKRMERVKNENLRNREKIVYHLDIGMSEPLQNSEMLIYPGTTFPEIYEKIKDRIGEDRIIEITREEALDMGANLVSNGMNVVMSKASPRLRDILEDKGYTVIEAKDYGLKDFVIMDGGPHCLTNILAPRL